MKKLDVIAGGKIYNSPKDFDRQLARYCFSAMANGGCLSRHEILEMGCAAGVMTEMLTQHCNFPEELHVVEGSKRAVDKAKKRVGDGVKFFVSMWEDFQPPILYDSVVMAHVLEHVDDPVLVLRKTSSWLKGGEDRYLHIIVPNAMSLHRRLGVVARFIDGCFVMSERDGELGHKRVYDFEFLKRDIETAGLEIVHHEGIFLKPLSNSQMISWNKDVLDALFVVGKELPEYCAEIYVKCRRTNEA